MHVNTMHIYICAFYFWIISSLFLSLKYYRLFVFCVLLLNFFFIRGYIFFQHVNIPVTWAHASSSTTAILVRSNSTRLHHYICPNVYVSFPLSSVPMYTASVYIGKWVSEVYVTECVLGDFFQREIGSTPHSVRKSWMVFFRSFINRSSFFSPTAHFCRREECVDYPNLPCTSLETKWGWPALRLSFGRLQRATHFFRLHFRQKLTRGKSATRGSTFHRFPC